MCALTTRNVTKDFFKEFIDEWGLGSWATLMSGGYGRRLFWIKWVKIQAESSKDRTVSHKDACKNLSGKEKGCPTK